MSHTFAGWLSEFFRNADRKPKPLQLRSARRRRLECERLEDRVVPAINILDVGAGTLDADLTADGIVSSGGSISRAALESIGANTSIGITSTSGDITFDDLTSPLALQTGAGNTVAFIASAGSILFADVTDSVTTAGGGILFSASLDLDLGAVDSGAGGIVFTAGGAVTVNSAVVSAGGTIFITADDDDTGGGEFTSTATGSVASLGGRITITASSVDLAGTLDADSVELSQAGTTTAVINLGGPDATTTGGPIAEVENNNTIASAQILGTILSFVDITADGDGTYDYYTFDALAGETFSFETTFGSFDTELFLYDSAGNLIAENDDFNGLLSFISGTFATSGTYTIGVGSFPSTGSPGGITGGTVAPGETYTLLIITDGVFVPLFNLSDAELDLITADTLRIGRQDNDGDITINAALTLNTVTTLSLRTDGGVVDGTAGEQADITVANLQFLAFAGVGTGDDIDTAVQVVASSGVNGGFNLVNTGDLIVGSVDSVDGVSATSGGNLTITATGSLTINEGVLGSNVILSTIDSASAGQDIVINAGGNIFSLSNSLVISAGDDLIVAAQLGKSGAAAILLTVDAGGSDVAGGTLDLSAAIFSTPNAATLTGGSGADNFILAPYPGNVINVNGGAPGASPGDTLTLDFTAATSPVLHPTGTGSGFFNFANRANVTFTGIESLVTSASYALLLDLVALGFQNGSANPDIVDISTTAGGVLNITVQNNSTGPATSYFSAPASNVTGITVIGSSDRDTFRIDETNAGLPPINLQGNGPAAAPGDAIMLNVTNATNATVVNGVPGSGSVTFGNRSTIQFSGIEILPGSVASITATDPNASERGAADPAIFTLTRTGIITAAVTVFYTVSGSAQSGLDYEPLTGSATFAAGATSVNIALVARNNSAVDGTRTVIITLAAGAGYTLGAQVAAVASISDNDQPRIGYLASSGPGPASDIRLLNGASTAPATVFDPFVGFTGGVVVAYGDVNGDGVADLAAGVSGAAAPHVKVFDGLTGQELLSFFAFDLSYSGGVTLALGDLNGDGSAELIVGAATGSPHVRVFDVATGAETLSFFAYTNTDGSPVATGVSVGAGDIDGNKRDEIVTGARSIAPHVKVFDAAGTAIRSFFAYDRPGSYGGVNIAVGDLNGDGRADIATATTFGVSSRISVVDGNGAIINSITLPPAPGIGPNIAIGDVDGNGSRELIVAIGPRVSFLDGTLLGLSFEVNPYTGYGGGVFVGA